MVYRGRVENGVIQLEGEVVLPEGTEVAVRPLPRRAKGAQRPPRPSIGRALLRLAGKAKSLPRDASRNIDHYLYGHSKR